jgi:hypothetical protein
MLLYAFKQGTAEHIFMKFDVLKFCQNHWRSFNIHLKQAILTTTLHERVRASLRA